MPKKLFDRFLRKFFLSIFFDPTLRGEGAGCQKSDFVCHFRQFPEEIFLVKAINLTTPRTPLMHDDGVTGGTGVAGVTGVTGMNGGDGVTRVTVASKDGEGEDVTRAGQTDG